MSWDIHWNVEKYRKEFEDEEHWQIHKKFLLAHKDKYPEERLVCLAQVFFNIEMLGCSYPEKVTKLVADLSKGVTDSFCNDKGKKLQRTFVKASDAANDKMKRVLKTKRWTKRLSALEPVSFQHGQSSTATMDHNNKQLPHILLPGEVSNTSCLQSNNQNLCSSTIACSKKNSVTNNFQQIDFNKCKQSACDINKAVIKPLEDEITQKKKVIDEGINADDCELNSSESVEYNGVIASYLHISDLASVFDDLKRVIIVMWTNENFFDNGTEIIARSFAQKGPPVTSFKQINPENENIIWQCTVTYKGKTVTTANALTKRKAKKMAIVTFLNELKKFCYILVEKVKYIGDGSVVMKFENEPCEQTFDNSVGNRMMRRMGWKGGGLGAHGQGISEPIMENRQINRRGFGNTITEGQVIQCFKKKLEAFVMEDTAYDLIFSSDLTQEERAKLHMIAKSLGLYTKSFGSADNRQLVVLKKKKSFPVIVDELLKCGGENERFRLIFPK